ncbi:hypothetical protein [Enterococcus olivae]
MNEVGESMGYIVIAITVLLLLGFAVRKMRRTSFFKRPTELEGYYLLVSKIEETGNYYGIFQQGDKEHKLEMSANLYVQLQPPVRGYLKAAEETVRSFEL